MECKFEQEQQQQNSKTKCKRIKEVSNEQRTAQNRIEREKENADEVEPY